jgi:hypothetical protein
MKDPAEDIGVGTHGSTFEEVSRNGFDPLMADGSGHYLGLIK